MTRWVCFLGALSVSVAMGCGGRGGRGASAPRQQKAPAAVDLRVAERFAAHYLGRIDQMVCMPIPVDGANEVPCTAFRIEQDSVHGQNEVLGIQIHCRRVEARGTGPACRFGNAALPGLPGWPAGQMTSGPEQPAAKPEKK